jgi:hypothetical protein
MIKFKRFIIILLAISLLVSWSPNLVDAKNIQNTNQQSTRDYVSKIPESPIKPSELTPQNNRTTDNVTVQFKKQLPSK